MFWWDSWEPHPLVWFPVSSTLPAQHCQTHQNQDDELSWDIYKSGITSIIIWNKYFFWLLKSLPLMLLLRAVIYCKVFIKSQLIHNIVSSFCTSLHILYIQLAHSTSLAERLRMPQDCNWEYIVSSSDPGAWNGSTLL